MNSECLLPEVIDAVIQDGEATADVLPSNEKWMGVTCPEDKPQVMEEIRGLVLAGYCPENLWRR
ncbi:hypothetical protein [Tichowtungia aerotolerans]|uniref:Uncharacterized protein n=1 Tax=Tichowtungia aerotolerans TaxID=2697043 RepID=A0A6P1M2J2_9BACT|nr:hypothetical protein [Tichowtungia aerotolerans]QHI68047.1 hypothetical protein GT409_00795 [Tichowtungia aerotolerans]